MAVPGLDPEISRAISCRVLCYQSAMYEHPVLNAIWNESFTPLGWFVPDASDGIASKDFPARFVILIGNAGPQMFGRFQRERDASGSSLDGWCRIVIGDLAERLGAQAVYPFDVAAPPFLKWAKRSGSIHQSPLGLGIHADYGLWHAYRAALIFPVEFDIPPSRSRSPCDSCAEKPCLSACPVDAFTGSRYDVEMRRPHRFRRWSRLHGRRMSCPPGVPGRTRLPLSARAGALSHGGISQEPSRRAREDRLE